MGIAKLDWAIDFKDRAMHIPAEKNSPIYEKAFYFINRNGHRCFYVVATKKDLESLTKLASLSYTYIDSNRKLEVVCTDPAFHETFEILFMETFELINRKKMSFSDAYEQVLSKYHAFLLGEVFLLPIKQIGLLNELVFLKMILLNEQAGMKYWHDMDEDFQFGKIFVELKATRSKLHKHIINGLAQLTVPPRTRKYLVSSLVVELNEKSTPDSINLYDTTVEILNLIPKASKRKLIERLGDRGYFHEFNGVEYKSFNYQFYDMKFIEVDSSFPCINLTTLNDSLYSYIDPQKVQYDLNLSGLSGKLEDVDEKFILQLLQKGLWAN